LQVKNDILFGLTSWFSAEIEFDKLDLGCGWVWQARSQLRSSLTSWILAEVEFDKLVLSWGRVVHVFNGPRITCYRHRISPGPYCI
jgi:hypothetical protein